MEFKISERDDDYKKSAEPVTGTPPFLITVCRHGTERSRDNPLPGYVEQGMVWDLLNSVSSSMYHVAQHLNNTDNRNQGTPISL